MGKVMGYKLFKSKIQLFNDESVSTKEKIGYCMKWLYDAREKLKKLKREKNHHEYYGPFLSPAHKSFVELRENEGKPVTSDEIEEFKLISQNEKLRSLNYQIEQTETTIESIEAELKYWESFKEIENQSDGEDDIYLKTAIEMVARKRSNARPEYQYKEIVRVLTHYYEQTGKEEKKHKNVVKATGIDVPPATFSTWKTDVRKEEVKLKMDELQK